MILETNRKDQLFEVRSSKEKDKFYRVDADIKVCTCPDFNFRFLKCKHIIAAEFAAGITSQKQKWDTGQYAQTKNAVIGLDYTIMTAKRGPLYAQNAGVTSTSDRYRNKM